MDSNKYQYIIIFCLNLKNTGFCYGKKKKEQSTSPELKNYLGEEREK